MRLRDEGIQPAPEEEANPGNVIDLMAALTASLGRDEAPVAPKTSKTRKAAAANKAPPRAGHRA